MFESAGDLCKYRRHEKIYISGAKRGGRGEKEGRGED